MERTETVEFVNMCMVRSGNKVLVQDRKKKDWPGITFPGGHVEQGESFTEAVIREIREETGLTISAPRLCGIKIGTKMAFDTLFCSTKPSNLKERFNLPMKARFGGKI